VGSEMCIRDRYPDALTEIAFAKMTELMPTYTEHSGRKFLRRQLTHLF